MANESHSGREHTGRGPAAQLGAGARAGSAAPAHAAPYRWVALANTTAVGGSMLTANSAAILTDAFPSDQRGFALGINQVAALAGQFIGLVAGGLLAALDWRAVFWVNVPVGIYGTLWAYRKLRDTGQRG